MNKWFLSLIGLLGISFGSCSQTPFKSVDTDEFKKIIAQENVQLVDVRTEQEFIEGHIANAMNIDVKQDNFMEQAKEVLNPEKVVAVYCRSGRRSADAASRLVKEGFQVVDLKGGIIAWTNKYGDTELEKSDSNGYIVFDGQQAPDFTVKLTDGKSVTLSEQRGKVVMLQFTASWCGVCRKEMPHIESDIWQAHKDNPDFVLIGIDRDEPLETVLKFGESTGITYPLGLDPGADIYAKYAVRESGITRNVLINREGKIIQRTRLYDEKEFKSLVERINNELNK